MVKTYDSTILELFSRSILEDEFQDLSQNDNLYGGKLSGNLHLTRLLNCHKLIKNPTLNILDVGSGSSKLEVFKDAVYYSLEPNPNRNKGTKVIEGWAENIDTNIIFDLLVCWGVFCFVRSVPETLISFNKRLHIGGYLVMDIVTKTIFPLAQTSDKDSFIRYCSLYGFQLEEEVEFITCGSHYRVGLRLKKFENFDIRRLRQPQSKGGVNNFFEERDFYLL